MSSIWNKWKNVTKKIGHFQALLIFSLLYYILITPVGLIYSTVLKLIGKRVGWDKFDMVP